MDKSKISKHARDVLLRLAAALEGDARTTEHRLPGALVHGHRLLCGMPHRDFWWLGVDFSDGYQWEAIFAREAWPQVYLDVEALFLRRGL